MKEEDKDLNYWKENAKDAYMTTPICVLRYITELEKAVKNNAVLPHVSRWACCANCKHFKHDILEDEDVTRCEKFEIDIDYNIYEKTQCSWFQPCG